MNGFLLKFGVLIGAVYCPCIKYILFPLKGGIVLNGVTTLIQKCIIQHSTA